MASHGALRAQTYERIERQSYYNEHLAGLTALERHRQLLAQLPGNLGLPAQDGTRVEPLSGMVTDAELLAQAHRFIRDIADDADTSYGARLARRYYDRLFKEYSIADLSRYKQQQIGLRWRTKAEVVTGKGQFVCGARGCEEHAGLATYEVPFSYREAGVCKQALVKLRVCSSCAAKLNYGRSSTHQCVRAGDAAAARTMGLGRRGKEQRRKRRRRGDCSSDNGSSDDAAHKNMKASHAPEECGGCSATTHSQGQDGNSDGLGATRPSGDGQRSPAPGLWSNTHAELSKATNEEFEALMLEIIAAEDAAATVRAPAPRDNNPDSLKQR